MLAAEKWRRNGGPARTPSIGYNGRMGDGMPWRLIGFGAAFIAALFVWRELRQAPSAKYGQAKLGASHVLAATEPGAPRAVTEPVAVPFARPVAERVAAPPDNGFDLAVAVATEPAPVVHDHHVVLPVPAPRPQHLVVFVHQQTPVAAPPRHYAAAGVFNDYVPGGPRTSPRPPSGLRGPRTGHVPSRPTTPARRPTRRVASRGTARRGTASRSQRRPRTPSRRRLR